MKYATPAPASSTKVNVESISFTRRFCPRPPVDLEYGDQPAEADQMIAHRELETLGRGSFGRDSTGTTLLPRLEGLEGPLPNGENQR